jgi:hypothetical protein
MPYRIARTNAGNRDVGRSRFFLWLTLAIVCIYLVAAFRVGLWPCWSYVQHRFFCFYPVFLISKTSVRFQIHDLSVLWR